jgi:hypothetical protein
MTSKKKNCEFCRWRENCAYSTYPEGSHSLSIDDTPCSQEEPTSQDLADLNYYKPREEADKMLAHLIAVGREYERTGNRHVFGKIEEIKMATHTEDKEPKRIMESGNAIYYENGTVEIRGHESGLPKIDGVVPAPFCDETERQKRFQAAIDQITMSGYMILETKRIRNDAFDKKDANTTLQIKWRTCKTEDEIKAVHAKIMDIMNKGATKEIGGE